MGVDCSITLPSDVRIHDVAGIIAILYGHKKTWNNKIPAVRVEGISFEHYSDIPSCCRIKIAPLANSINPNGLSFLYYFEFGDYGERGILPRSTPLWAAIGRRLIRFFGGTIDYNDSDDRDVDMSCLKPRECNSPSNGKPWDDFQKALFAVEPLTKEEIDDCIEFAAYDINGRWI